MIPLLDCAGLPRALPSESASKLAHSKRPGDIAIGLGTRVAGWLGVDWGEVTSVIFGTTGLQSRPSALY